MSRSSILNQSAVDHREIINIVKDTLRAEVKRVRKFGTWLAPKDSGYERMRSHPWGFSFEDLSIQGSVLCAWYKKLEKSVNGRMHATVDGSFQYSVSLVRVGSGKWCLKLLCRTYTGVEPKIQSEQMPSIDLKNVDFDAAFRARKSISKKEALKIKPGIWVHVKDTEVPDYWGLVLTTGKASGWSNFSAGTPFFDVFGFIQDPRTGKSQWSVEQIDYQCILSCGEKLSDFPPLNVDYSAWPNSLKVKK